MSDKIAKEDMYDAIDQLRSRLDDLERMVDTIPGYGAKMCAKDDGGMPLDVGDKVSGIIEDDGENTRHGDVLVRVDGVVVFANNHEGSVGDVVNMTITTTEDRHARGVITGVGE